MHAGGPYKEICRLCFNKQISTTGLADIFHRVDRSVYRNSNGYLLAYGHWKRRFEEEKEETKEGWYIIDRNREAPVDYTLEYAFTPEEICGMEATDIFKRRATMLKDQGFDSEIHQKIWFPIGERPVLPKLPQLPEDALTHISDFSKVFREGDVSIPLEHFQILQDCLQAVYEANHGGRSLAGDSDHEVTFVAIMTHHLLQEVYGLKCQIWSLQDTGANGFANRRRRVSVIVTEGGNVIDVHGLCSEDGWRINREGLSVWHNDVFTRGGIFSVYRKFGKWTPRMKLPRGNPVELPSVMKDNSYLNEFSPADFNKVGIMKNDLCALWTIHALKDAYSRPRKAKTLSYSNSIHYGIDGGVFVFPGMKNPMWSLDKKEHAEIYKRILDMYVQKTQRNVPQMWNCEFCSKMNTPQDTYCRGCFTQRTTGLLET